MEYADTANLTELKKRVRPGTKAVYLETPTNPMMRVTDIRAAADLARAFEKASGENERIIK